MKKSVLVVSVLLLLIAVPSFAATKTTSVSVGAGWFGMTDFANGLSNFSVEIGYRHVTCPKDVGFYYGVDLAAGYFLGSFLWTFSPFDISLDALAFLDAGYFNTKARLPVGYRFTGAGKNGAPYIGVGPEILFTRTTGMSLSGGGFLEFGWQTNKTEGMGFHFGLVLTYVPLHYSFSSGSFVKYFWDPLFFQSSLQFGVSWRRVKGEKPPED